jgi:hypothetical protein
VEDDDAGELTLMPASKQRPTYWPRDLLALDIDDVRILTYGYDSHITKGYSSANKNNIFAHAKDLLFALQREKPRRRRLIFIAHSLGGILVKEVLPHPVDVELC